ncbi:hypothetical protein BJY00DRAFT_56424 [Aspergillus carlsbadensis]|nr:hypothetical protein BJY00DRAFT_56424 [Aspergillus carlsbadensis]
MVKASPGWTRRQGDTGSAVHESAKVRDEKWHDDRSATCMVWQQGRYSNVEFHHAMGDSRLFRIAKEQKKCGLLFLTSLLAFLRCSWKHVIILWIMSSREWASLPLPAQRIWCRGE